MRYRRSLLASFLVIVLTALLLSACSNNNKENKLSELEDIKLNQYMTDSGITIPESVDMDTIRSIIIELETILDKGIMPSEKVLDFPVDCNTLTGSVNL